MKKYGHLIVYDLEIKTKGLVHIGSGKTYEKTEYCLFRDETGEGCQVAILNSNEMFRYLIANDKVAEYEAYVMEQGEQSTDSDKKDFWQGNCGLSSAEIRAMSLWVLDASEVLDEKKQLKVIHGFIRNAQGQPYIPGSSVKGALRTAILVDKITKDQNRQEKIFDKNLEGKDLRNIMRGISVSDSIPISNKRMIISNKVDVETDGVTMQEVNVCRECLKPGTIIKMKLTLDNSVLKGRIGKEMLENVIQSFADYYVQTYMSKFKAPKKSVNEDFQNCLLLGGGAGFFSKTIDYPFFGEKKGLAFVSEQLRKNNRKDKNSPNHYHENDVKYGISPRMMKYGEVNGTKYLYGVCEVKLS